MKKNLLTIIASLLIATVCAHAQAAGGLSIAKPDSAKKRSSKDDLREQIANMQFSIGKAILDFSEAGKGSTDRIKDIDALQAEIRAALVPLQDGGQLQQAVAANLAETKNLQAKYQEKSVKVGLPSKFRIKYEELAERYDQNINNVLDTKQVLDKSRKNLEGTLKELDFNKEFIADLLQADQTEDANEALQMVIEEMQGMEKEIKKLMEGIENDDDGAGPKPPE
jgi:hypothetical protein